MKQFFRSFISLVVFSGLFAATAFAQTYPYTNPTYLPNIRPTAFTAASGVANSAVVLNSIGVTTLQLTGTCTNLVGQLQGTNDGTNWVTLNLYPNQATVAASAVTSVTTTGYWAANTAGLNQVRFNNSGVTGTACVGTIAGSARTFSLPR